MLELVLTVGNVCLLFLQLVFSVLSVWQITTQLFNPLLRSDNHGHLEYQHWRTPAHSACTRRQCFSVEFSPNSISPESLVV